MTPFEKFCLTVWFKIVAWTLCAVLAGCGAAVVASGDYDAAIVAIADADPDAQPELPDSLDEAEPTGMSGNGDSSAPVSDKLPKVQLFVTDGCPPCVEAKKWLKGSKIPWVQMPTNPDWTKSTGFPSLCWKVGDVWNYSHGWGGGADFEKRYYGSLK